MFHSLPVGEFIACLILPDEFVRVYLNLAGLTFHLRRKYHSIHNYHPLLWGGSGCLGVEYMILRSSFVCGQRSTGNPLISKLPYLVSKQIILV